MKIKEHNVILDSGEIAHLLSCIGTTINQLRSENYRSGKIILTDERVKELQKLQDRLEHVH